MNAAATAASPLLSEEFQTDAYPVIAKLREEDPVHWVPGLNFWFVTRYDDVRRLFNDPENATTDRRVSEGYVPPPEGTYMRWAADHGLFSLPPKEHARVRRLVSAAFTPRAVARMEAQVREVVERFAALLHGRSGVVDLMKEFTDPIPNSVISRITGVPPAGDDEVRFRELAQLTIRGFFSFGDESLRKRGEQAFLELAEWVREMASERRAAPRDDLISDLVQAHDMDDRMTSEEIVMLITGLLGAGSETTAIGGMLALMTLLDQPEALERLRTDRSLLLKALNEILRFGFGGPGSIPRYAVRDFEIRGKTIRRGQTLMLSFGGANRDPSVYPDPDRLDLDRDPKDLLLFGSGPHHCLGAHLARTELRCMIDSALDFLPPGARFRLDLMTLTSMGFIRRPENFPVDFGS